MQRWFAAKYHQIAFPIAEYLAGLDVIRPVVDGAFQREHLAARAAGVTRFSLLAAVRKIPCQSLGLTISSVEIGINRFMADGGCMAFELQAACNLFR